MYTKLVPMKILLLYQIVPEHRPWLSSPIGIRFDSGEIPSSTEEQVALLKERLSSPEVIELLIDQKCLLDNNREDGGFEGDATFKFVEVRCTNGNVCFLFRNSEEEELEVEMDSKVVDVF